PDDQLVPGIEPHAAAFPFMTRTRMCPPSATAFQSTALLRTRIRAVQWARPAPSLRADPAAATLALRLPHVPALRTARACACDGAFDTSRVARVPWPSWPTTAVARTGDAASGWSSTRSVGLARPPARATGVTMAPAVAASTARRFIVSPSRARAAGAPARTGVRRLRRPRGYGR